MNDPTNGGFFEMDKVDSYKHLQPLRTDIEVFEDDQFGYDFYQGHLNVSRVKTSGDILTVPFSTNKLRVSSFIPHHDLPKNVKQVYLGRNIVSLGDEQVVSLSERGTNLESVFCRRPKHQIRGQGRRGLHQKLDEEKSNRSSSFPPP